jgi:small subunit ribosomal protein S30e
MPTHGSLTKAGKVRGQTPKIEGRKRTSVHSIQRIKNNYRKRFVLQRTPGQNRPGQRKRRRL